MDATFLKLKYLIESRIRSILERPEVWGSNESVELQIIQLLEVRFLLMNNQSDWTQSAIVLKKYLTYLSNCFPNSALQPLPLLLEQNKREEEFTKILAKFVNQQIDAVAPPPRRTLPHFAVEAQL